MTTYRKGDKLAEGKTKIVYTALDEQGLAAVGCDNRALCVIESKDNISAFDGVRRDVIEGKAAISNATVVNTFNLLKPCMPIAFVEGMDERSFVARKCEMLPYEVVVRREAHGSYLQREPHVAKETRFNRLLVEFYLKTTGQKFDGHDLPCDDPLIRWKDIREPGVGPMQLVHPKKESRTTEPFLVLDALHRSADFWEMAKLAVRAFLVLESAWQHAAGIRLVDYKVEFGYAHTPGYGGETDLLLADVIDADSGRLVENGKYIDKQVYREGGTVEEVFRNFVRIRDLTARFRIPKSVLVLWRGSDKDDLAAFNAAAAPYEAHGLEVRQVVCSAHKDTEEALRIMRELERDAPNAVVLAIVGRSNGLGPVIAGNTRLTVINVPQGLDKSPHDVWSSLSMPSDVPCATILNPANAVLSALRILSRDNPRLCMALAMSKPGAFIYG